MDEQRRHAGGTASGGAPIHAPAPLELEGIRKVFFAGTANEVVALDGIDLAVPAGQFVSIIGSNGSGKSTLLNAVAGTFPVTSGRIVLGGSDVTKQPDYVRSRRIGRVFQDPRAGTAPDMTIEENLALALLRTKRSGLRMGVTSRRRAVMREQLARLGMGLEDRLKAGVAKLSGGQRQAMSLLMATIAEPSLLLLDEHTAALDPKVAHTIMELTGEIVAERHLTTLMVTHNMELALRYGDRLFMMHGGRIVLDLGREQKQALQVSDLIEKFHEVAGEAFAVDRLLLDT
jgi:putative ABC transport system ATP-binding protein